jgi:hypothetical protein
MVLLVYAGVTFFIAYRLRRRMRRRRAARRASHLLQAR